MIGGNVGGYHLNRPTARRSLRLGPASLEGASIRDIARRDLSANSGVGAKPLGFRDPSRPAMTFPLAPAELGVSDDVLITDNGASTVTLSKTFERAPISKLKPKPDHPCFCSPTPLA
jgi:hypothetical protein